MISTPSPAGAPPPAMQQTLGPAMAPPAQAQAQSSSILSTLGSRVQDQSAATGARLKTLLGQ